MEEDQNFPTVSAKEEVSEQRKKFCPEGWCEPIQTENSVPLQKGEQCMEMEVSVELRCIRHQAGYKSYSPSHHHNCLFFFLHYKFSSSEIYPATPGESTHSALKGQWNKGFRSMYLIRAICSGAKGILSFSHFVDMHFKSVDLFSGFLNSPHNDISE